MTGDNIQGDKNTAGNISNSRAVVIGSGKVIYYEAADATPPTPGAPPFKGLDFYDVDDAPLYFGRETLTAMAVNHLREHRFLAVVGASGSGKSSLVRAGVVAAFQRGSTLMDGVSPPPDSERWLYLILSPTRNPLESMAKGLANTGRITESQQQMMHAMEHDETCLENYLQQILANRQTSECAHVMLVVDQFEELFSYVVTVDDANYLQRKQRQKAFITNLLHAANSDLTSVVITLRADFYAYCAEYEGLRSKLAQHQMYIGPMNRGELESAIVRPVQQDKWVFQPELVDLILDDVEGQPGMLPLLSHALMETWKARSGVTMTFAGYLKTGRVQGAIAATATQLFQRFSESQQLLAQTIFLQLIELGESSEDTRRRVQMSDLVSSATDVSELLAIVDALAKARLITVGNLEKPGEQSQWLISNADLQNTYVQLTHEALMREWPLLRQWITTHRNVLLFRKRYDAAMEQWLTVGKDEDALLRGRFLEEAIEWHKQYSASVGKQREAFLAASVQLWEQEKAIEQQNARERRVRSQIRTVLLTTIGLLLPPALFLGAQLWMFDRQYSSRWQLTAFPSNSITSIVSNRHLQEGNGTQLCVGTADIGVGCSEDLETWNLYQAGLPQTTPSILNNRNRWWGYLVGNVWSAKILAVRGLTFDGANTERLVAAIDDGGLYERRLNEPNWHQFSATAPLTEVAKIAVYADWIAVLRSSTDYSTASERGKLYQVTENEPQWNSIGGEKDDEYGIIRDITLAQTLAPSTTVALFIAADQGLFRRQESSASQRLYPRNDDEPAAVLVVIENNANLYWIATSDPSGHAKSVSVSLYGSRLDEQLHLSDIALLGEMNVARLPYRLAVAPTETDNCTLPPCRQFWLLFPDGTMLRYEPGTVPQPLPNRPAWIPITRDLHVEPWASADNVRYLLMVGHEQGLIHYCPGLDDPFYLCTGDALDNASQQSQ